jgi:N-acetylglucosaminyl-diphospho-decaprenol L-rhamnosyltransferase
MMHFTPPGDAQSADGKLAVVVLAYGAGDQVAGLLDYLDGEAITVSCELILVHNPRHSSETLALPTRDATRVVEMGTNGGYVGGMNAGIDLALESGAEFVLLLTHDVRIAGDAVQQLYELSAAQADLGVVGPILCRPGGEAYSAGFARGSGLQMRHRIPTDEIPRPIWPCAAIDGSAMMWRATALQEVRGFDERFFMYFDDLDICARASRRRWEIAVATEVRVISAPGGSNRRSAHAYLRARNGLAYARTFGPAGLGAGLVQCAVGLWHATPKPGGVRFRDADARRVAAAYWRGTLRGVLDYFRGRWGSPPPPVLRDSDIEVSSV